jgi:hypothetical protein
VTASEGGDSERVIVVDEAEGGLRAGFFEGGAEGANDTVNRPPRGCGRERGESDEGVFEFRVGRERAPGGGDEPGDARVGEGVGEDGLADEAGGAEEERRG